MRSVLVFSVGLALVSSAAQAVEILALRDGSIVRVAEYEVKGKRVVLKSTDGQLLSLPVEQIDFEMSKKATEVLRKDEQRLADEERTQEEERRRREAARDKKSLSLVEASRRYGVDSPGVNRATGSATAPAGSSARPDEGSESGSTRYSGGNSKGALQQAQLELNQVRQRKLNLERQIAAAKSDLNPDPVAAAGRRKRVADLEANLQKVLKRMETSESRVSTLQAAVEAEEKARKAREEAEKEDS